MEMVDKHKKHSYLEDIFVQGALLIFLLMLSLDAINPVKAFSSFLHIPSSYFAPIFGFGLITLIYTNVYDVVYYCVRVFLHSILTITFKTIEIVGADNIPMEGPVIFTGNHSNQFVDGLVVMMNCQRKVGVLIAEKSWHLPVVGFLAKAMGCIPVMRPQDSVSKGQGRIWMAQIEEQESELEKEEKTQERTYLIEGEGTEFLTHLHVGDQVRAEGKTVHDSGDPVKVLEVLDDTHIKVAKPLLDAKNEQVKHPSDFGIFKKVDQSHTFSEVYNHLRRGNCVGIFPEGGSHDRTDLLPLKAGVAIMALGVKDKYHINVPVVPIGLNYFRGHRFRGRVVLEFGTPINVDEQLMEEYRENKRAACNKFLHRVEDGMRSVIVTAPNYHVLQLVYAARRLFQRSGIRLSAQQTQDLNRRFSEGYKILSTSPKANADLQALEKKVEKYTQTLDLMGLKDYQVPYIAWWSIRDVIGSALFGFFIFALASIPAFVLNAPVGLLARIFASKKQKKALEGSKVKITGKDVLMSHKITISIVAVPTLWLLYALAALVFTDWYWSSILLLIMSFPLFSYFGVRSVEAGMIEFKNVRPLFYRLLPQYRRMQDELPIVRAKLQNEIRDFIAKYAEELGPLADEKKIDWIAYMHARSSKPALKDEGGSEKPEKDQITEKHDLSFLKFIHPSALDLKKSVLNSVELQNYDKRKDEAQLVQDAVKESQSMVKEDPHSVFGALSQKQQDDLVGGVSQNAHGDVSSSGTTTATSSQK